MKDEMTGLYNRLGYHNIGQRLFKEVIDEGGRLGILFIDMDRLKFINDTYGHASGDQAILCISKAMLHSLPRRSVSVRYGGDEFLALVPADDETRMESIVSALRAAILSEAKALGIGDVPDISTGYVLTDPAVDRALEDYVEAADSLMYQQKRGKHVER